MAEKANQILIGPFTQLVTLEDLSLKGALSDDQLALISNAGVLVDNGKVVLVGDFDELAKDTDHVQEVEGEQVCIPGLIDSHTHICFGGSRARDYGLRNSGKTYLEIAKAGGGIWDTVTQTRKSSQEELLRGIVKRAARHLSEGVTTIEVKSGYGLSIDEELKMLEAIKQANGVTTSDLVSTCLAAHILPRDFEGSHEEYLTHMSQDLFPLLKERQLTNRIDAFIEEEAFSSEITTTYFEKARQMGFEVTVHADQFHAGGSEVAVKVDAVSADHLEASGDKEIDLLARSNTIATALPGASMGLGCAFTPARKILDRGGCVSIASDWNPGSAPMGDLLMQAAVIGSYEKLSNAEVLAGITFRAAAALKLSDRGRIAPGMIADLSVFSTDHFNEILYHQGKLKPSMVFKNGELASPPTQTN